MFYSKNSSAFVPQIAEHLWPSAFSKPTEDHFKTENDIPINYLPPNVPDLILYWAETSGNAIKPGHPKQTMEGHVVK